MIRKIFGEGLLSGRQVFYRTFPLALLMFGITQLLLMPSMFRLVQMMLWTQNQSWSGSMLALSLLNFILLSFSFLLFGLGSTLGLIFTASCHQKKPCSWDLAIKLMSSVLPQVLLSGLISGFLLFIGFSIHPIFAFVIATFLSLYLPIVVFESVSAFQGLKLSIKRSSKALVYCALVISLIWLFMFGSPLLIHFIGDFAFPNFTQLPWIQEVIQTLVDAALFPFSQGLVIALYFNALYRV